MRIGFRASPAPAAQAAYTALTERYGDTPLPRADVIVALGGDGFMLRYNSKLPIVLYVPKGVEVRYRIWSASKQIKQATAE